MYSYEVDNNDLLKLGSKAHHTWNSKNKAIVDYTSPAPCTPITPFPAIGDAAYRQPAGGRPSHGRRQHAQNIW